MCNEIAYCAAVKRGEACPKEDAFLEESLEATIMHEPPAYPADKLEWSDLLRGIGNVD